jgi:hypothetical protein
MASAIIAPLGYYPNLGRFRGVMRVENQEIRPREMFKTKGRLQSLGEF